MRRCKEDAEYRTKTKELFHRDILFAFNAFFYTYDPRKRPFHNIPFATWGYEDELLLELQEGIDKGQDRLVEKSRDMGVSWSVVGTFVWYWLKPEGGNDFLMGSRIEDYVDKKGDMRTLFAKARYLHYRLPKWLRPKGFKKRIHDNHMKLVNPESGAVIAGESNNANFSTGGRYAGVLFDEFAKWESTDESAWTAAGDATPCRIPVSTPFGAGGQYYMLAIGGKTRRLRYHWSRHPEKGLGLNCLYPPPNEDDKESLGDGWKPEEVLRSPWYDRERERRRPAEVAQELDIDYLGSGYPIFDGKAWRSLMFYRELRLQPVEVRAIDFENVTTRVVTGSEDNEGLIVIFNRHDPKHQYVIGVDVVEGVEGGDFASIKLINRETKDVDLSYFSQLDEVTLAKVCYLISKLFTGEEAPWLAIETTGPGLATFDICHTFYDIENLFMMPNFDSVKQTVTYKKGWRTTVGSRNMLVAGIRSYLAQRAGYIDPRLVGECMTFVRNKVGKPIAKAGCHDDEVMSFGIAIQVDEIVPYEAREEPVQLREDGLPLDVMDPKCAKDVEEPTHEEACLAQSLAKRNMMEGEREYWETRGELQELALGSGLMDLVEDW